MAPLFPLDTLLIALLSAGIGAYLYLKGAPKRFLSLLHIEKEYKRGHLISSTLRASSALLSLYMVGALLWGFAFNDWGKPYFSCLIPFFVTMIAPALLLAYDLYLRSGDLLSEKKRAIIFVSISIYALLGMVSSLIVFCLVPNIIIIAAQPYFRLDAVCSLNLAPFLLLLPPAFYLLYLWATFFREKSQIV